MKINNLSFKYKNKEILKNIDMVIDDLITTIIGLNGEGKTTLAKLIMGFLSPLEGSITYSGEKIFCASENILPPYVTITEIVSSQKLDVEYFQLLLKTFECEEYQNTFIKDLSFGTQKKMNLILVFLQKCDLIILDEPSTGLDVISQMNLAKIIKKDKRKIIIISHDFNLIKEVSKKIYVLKNCKITEYIYENESQLKDTLQKISDKNE